MKNKFLKVLSLPVDDGGCGWYRIRQPFEKIHLNTPHDTHIIDTKKDDMFEVAKAMQVADVVVIRPGAYDGMQRILAMPEFTAKKYVLDIDDNVELISPYSNHYEEYGVEDYYDSHIEKWIWKDGERDFDIERNKKRLTEHLTALRNANLVTVTTKLLKAYAEEYNKNVAILPNCIDFTAWWPLNLKPNKQLRVIWSGGSSHYEDWYSIQEPLNDLMRKYQFKLVMVGHAFPGVIDEDNKHLVETSPWVPFKGHSYRLMCMAADIALIPLADLPFNYYKSSVKWYEMSAMAVPSVVSNIQPYSDDIKDGVTAMGYRTKRQFHEKLESLILHKCLRSRIGNAAFKWVKENRDAEKCTKLWVNAYSKLTTTS